MQFEIDESQRQQAVETARHGEAVLRTMQDANQSAIALWSRVTKSTQDAVKVPADQLVKLLQGYGLAISLLNRAQGFSEAALHAEIADQASHASQVGILQTSKAVEPNGTPSR